MQDYSDLLFLIGAIAIYALLVNNTNNNVLRNSRMLTSTEMEYGAISVAQDVAENARWTSYIDDNKAYENKLEEINNNPEYEDYEVDVEVENYDVPESERSNKKIEIKVTSKYLTKGKNKPSSVTMSYVKTKN